MRGFSARVRFVVRAALRGLRASAATAAVAIVAMALALVLAGAFAVVVGNMRGLLVRVGEQLTLTAYLSPETDAGARDALVARAAGIEGVQAVESVTPEEALARFPERTGVSAGWMDVLDRNPLPASLDVRLRPESRDAAAVARVRDALAQLPGILDVSAGDEWVAGYARATGFVRGIGLAMGAVLALATLVMVSSTIRLALKERRDEIEILSLVGAGRATLRAPFLLEGMAQGACAGVLALVLLRVLFALAQPAAEAAVGFLAGPGAVQFLTWPEHALLVGAGALLGLLGAALSLMADEGA